MSIGQGFMLSTPLQLAVMTARIASKGKIIEPRLVKSVGGIDLVPAKTKQIKEIDPKYWDYIHDSMKGVVHSARGTATSINRGLTYTMAGKTGTAQVVSISADEDYDKSKLNKRQWDHALFIAFAPFDDPQIAVGLIVENGEHGSSAAAPIARSVIDAYLQANSKISSISKDALKGLNVYANQ
jgi:penicillin-binding protein 2